MPATGIDDTATAIPVLRYRDLAAAVDWLCRNLGFQEHLIVKGEGGSLRLAQLALGGCIVMLAPVQTTELDRLMIQPDEIGGAATQITYFFVADTAAHFERAKAAGVDIVLDEDDKDHVKRSYSCRDPEGHIWSFGTYDPRRQSALRRQPSDRAERHDRSRASGVLSAVSMVFSFTMIAAVGIMGWVVLGWSHNIDPIKIDPIQRPAIAVPPTTEASTKAVADPQEDAIESATKALRTAKDAAEQEASRARDLLAQALKRESDEKAAKAELQQAMARALAEANAARVEAERATGQAQVLLAREQADREAAQRTVEDALGRVDSERRAREVAESSAAEARGQLAKERNARESAQRSRKELEARLARQRTARKAPPQKASTSVVPGIP